MTRKRSTARLLLITVALFPLGVEGRCTPPSDIDLDSIFGGVDDNRWGGAADHCHEDQNLGQGDANGKGSGDARDEPPLKGKEGGL